MAANTTIYTTTFSNDSAVVNLTRDQIMTYPEAAKFLGKQRNTIAQAVTRGVLTPLPRKGLVRYLLTDQVKLFKNKPIALSSLTQDEYKVWEQCVKIAKGKLPDNPHVVPLPLDGYEIGRRFATNIKQGIYDTLMKKDESLKRDALYPLAN